MITMQEFEPHYQAEAVKHVLDIENNEFNMRLTLEMQPDLADIRKFVKYLGRKK